MHIEAKKAPRSKTKLTASKVTAQSIAEQTTAFLKAGGKIKKIRSGVRDEEAATAKERTQ